MTPLGIGVVVAAVTVGATLQGTVGFGLGMVAAPILALVDPRLVPGPLLCAALLLTVLVSYREHPAMDVPGVLWALFGRLPGVILGVLMLRAVPGERVTLVFGILVLTGVIMTAIGPRVSLTRRALFGAGMVSGFMGTTSGVGGPPMALLYQHAAGERIRATLAGFFTVGVSLSLVALAVGGQFAVPEVYLATLLMPGVVLGFVLSRPLAHLLGGRFTRPAVLVTAALAGGAVILRYFL